MNQKEQKLWEVVVLTGEIIDSVGNNDHDLEDLWTVFNTAKTIIERQKKTR